PTVIYGAAQGLQEGPIVGVAFDEAKNLWVATHAALYLMKPGQTTFHRYVGADGLHLQDNPQVYCDRWLVPPECPIYGGAANPGITEIAGGKAGEVFVGYAGNDDGTQDKWDPNRHSGKLDRIRLQPDGTLEVKRFDMVAGNHGVEWWHDRTVERLLYDHFS